MSRKIVEYFLFGNLSKEYVNFVKIWKRNQRNFSPILELNIFGWNCFFLSMASGAESVQNWARDVLVSCKIEFLKNNKTICPKLNWKRTHFKHNNTGEKQNLSLHFPFISSSLEFRMPFHWNSNLCATLPLAAATKLNSKSLTYPLSASQHKFKLFKVINHLDRAVLIFQWAVQTYLVNTAPSDPVITTFQHSWREDTETKCKKGKNLQES